MLVLSDNSWHGEIERDNVSRCVAMMIELWMRKREMGDEDVNNMEEYAKSGV
jgi:hypothetical protein